MFQGLAAQRLLALFVAGWLVFNFPLLGLWDRDAMVFGIPLFPAALFIAWAVLIAWVFWINEHTAGDDPQSAAHRPAEAQPATSNGPAAD
jgi:hypothetical protein